MPMRIWTTCVSLAACVNSMAGGLIAAEPAAKGELIPRQVLFGNPDKTSLRVSPDGKHVAYLAPLKGVLNVWVAPTGDLKAARAITADTNRGIRQFFWAYNNEQIVYLQDKGGDENWKVYAADIAGGSARDLTPFEEIIVDGKAVEQGGKKLRPAARIEGVSERFPDEIVIGLNNRSPMLHDLHRVNLRTGAMTLLYRNDRYVNLDVDDAFRLRLAVQMLPDGSQRIEQNTAWKSPGTEPKFEAWQTIGQEDALTSSPSGFDKTGEKVYMMDSRGRDTGAMFAIDLGSGEKRLLAESPLADAGGVIVHPTEKTVQAVAFNHLRTEWTVLDPSLRKDLDYLKTVNDGEIAIASRSLDDAVWSVTFADDNGPAKSYVYDRRAGKATFAFTNYSALEGVSLAPMHPVVIKSRDGLDLVSYLTLPVGSFKDPATGGTPRPGAPLPMVLFVHGGPWARDNWGFNPVHQWLANRGYAVLSVNFRGSTGFGKAFVNAGNREWAGKMHDDLIDAVNWAVREKIADEKKVAIMGGSYGGYSTLVGLTFTPDVFACGVDIVGPSNIVTLLNSIPPYWAPMISMFTTRVGDHRTEEGRKFLESRSPLTFVDRIKRPLLIGQGANDPRVKQAEADQIVSAMQSRKIPVTYVLYPDEGHGFARPENRLSFYAVTEAFLSEHLGGRVEPIGDDFKNSSIQIPQGGELIKGLAPAVKGG
jgi:dipeptidyl aminopeptidase/acylaminoacyl peptidase